MFKIILWLSIFYSGTLVANEPKLCRDSDEIVKIASGKINFKSSLMNELNTSSEIFISKGNLLKQDEVFGTITFQRSVLVKNYSKLNKARFFSLEAIEHKLENGDLFSGLLLTFMPLGKILGNEVRIVFYRSSLDVRPAENLTIGSLKYNLGAHVIFEDLICD